jgi:hypothetical protein
LKVFDAPLAEINGFMPKAGRNTAASSCTGWMNTTWA